MSAAKHTPGPWLIEGRTVYSLMHHGWNRGVEVLKNRFWASCYHDRSVTDEEAEANARLIAAAPELLEALQSTWAVIDAVGLRNLVNGVPLGATVWFVKAHDARTMAMAAIAKAEGGAA